jgi:hypothetical protein
MSFIVYLTLASIPRNRQPPYRLQHNKRRYENKSDHRKDLKHGYAWPMACTVGKTTAVFRMCTHLVKMRSCQQHLGFI